MIFSITLEMKTNFKIRVVTLDWISFFEPLIKPKEIIHV